MASAKDLLNKIGGGSKPLSIPTKPLIAPVPADGADTHDSHAAGHNHTKHAAQAAGKGKSPSGGGSSVPTSVRPKV